MRKSSVHQPFRQNCLAKAICLFAIFLVAGGFSCKSSQNIEAQEKPPNVLLIISDDQAWTDYGFMGHPMIKTPRLDQLAKQSCVFTRGYVPASLCRPSLATIATGLFPTQHGITGNDPRPFFDESKLNGSEQEKKKRKRAFYQQANQKLIARMQNLPTIPRMLQEKGYASLQTGKWWEGNFSVGGFTHGMTHGDPRRGGRHGDGGLEIGRKGLKPIFEFIDNAGEKPFFVWYAPFLPHTPHNPPKEILAKYRKLEIPARVAKYYAMCEWFDQTCGELLDYLDQKKLDENTVVIYVTDNGWIQRTQKTKVPKGWFPSFAPRSKQSPYEGGIRTPIMIRWPGKVKPTIDQATLVSSIDLAPTILKLAGLKPTRNMSGIDLMDVAQGKPTDREQIWGEIFAHDIMDLDDPKESRIYRWCIRGDFKVIEFHPGQMQRYKPLHQRKDSSAVMYHLKVDPRERFNLADEQPYQVRAIRESLNELTTDVKLIKLKTP